MTATELVILFAQTVGADVNNLRRVLTDLDSKQGDLATLNTSHKDTLVGAITEVKNQVTQLQSNVINQATVQGLIDAAITGIKDGAPTAWDTFKEVAAYIAQDQSAEQAILAALAKRVRVDAAQNFTEAEQTQGRNNIGAAAAADLGDISSFDPRQTYITQRDLMAPKTSDPFAPQLP